MDFHRGFIAPLLLILAAVLLIGGGVYVYMQTKPAEQSPTTISQLPDGKAAEEDPASGWLVYTDTVDGFSLKYSPVLTQSLHGASVVLTHAVNYPHPNVCDMKGGAKPLDAITDFDLALQVVDTNLKETIQQNEQGVFGAETFVGSSIKPHPGILDEITIGTLHGYRVTKGAEGCGVYTYYFPLSDGRTLFGYRPFVTEFNPIIGDYKKYLAVPGVIPPEQEEMYVNSILASFKLSTQIAKTYRSQQACESATGKSCTFQSCDYNCDGTDSTGWVPLP